MMLRSIDRVDSNYLRGWAILAIMLHNYFHILRGAPGENEFGFVVQHTLNLFHNLSRAPHDILKQLFSYWGHYGVQLFVFLSGYGLAQKYRTLPPPTLREFMIPRINKIYPVLFVAVVSLLLYKTALELLVPAKDIDLTQFLKEALLKLSLLSNLVPGEALSISGPWWFFSMILQLYLLTPLLLRLGKRGLLLVIASAWILQLMVVGLITHDLEWIRVNFLGHLPEYCLGIYLARRGGVRLRAVHAALLLVVFLAGSFSAYVWVFSFLSVPLLSWLLYQRFTPEGKAPLAGVFRFFGKNSLYFFAVHGLCRAPFVSLGNQSPLWSIAGAALFLATVTGLSLLFKQVVLLVERLVDSGWRKYRQKNRAASFL